MSAEKLLPGIRSPEDLRELSPEQLDQLAAEHDSVSIGSYPVIGDYAYRVRLTFDSQDSAAIDRAVSGLLSSLPPEMIVPSRVAEGRET